MGDTSKYTLPATTGTQGQVLTVSTTTSELVFADTSRATPNYILVHAQAGISVTDNSLIRFQTPKVSNNLSISGTNSQTINLPSGKIYKATVYINLNPESQTSTDFEFKFYDDTNSEAIGVAGIWKEYFNFNDND